MAKGTAEVPVTEKKLPELIGGFVQRVIEDRTKLTQCANELQQWHDAQPVENRAELVRENKKVLETAKQITEYLFSQYVQIAQKDV